MRRVLVWARVSGAKLFWCLLTYTSSTVVITVTMYSLTPNLMVDDLGTTIEWYQETFDAEVVAQLPTGEPDPWWAQIVIDDVSLMFQEQDNLVQKLPDLEDASPGQSMPLFITVEDAEILHEKLESAGVEFSQKLHETEFGWFQFAVKDVNGYLLWFGEKLSPDRMGPVVR